ncbi:uncharacterized protein G2W53_035574 [Senna tora]|uniref:Uncharacterized protein n=1 Tax=Senna tora TaxID=362788 RepID=A0A834STB8_9FABA|nr:uncharacterized protein G2W53_035574 [Senna tora]
MKSDERRRRSGDELSSVEEKYVEKGSGAHRRYPMRHVKEGSERKAVG